HWPALRNHGAAAGAGHDDPIWCFQTLGAAEDVPSFRAGMTMAGSTRPAGLQTGRKDSFHIAGSVWCVARDDQPTDHCDTLAPSGTPALLGNSKQPVLFESLGDRSSLASG